MTGGASASYGTDAVAGVVNFLLDTEFEGFKTRGQAGVTEYGDGESWEAGFAFGMDLTERLHILGSVSRYDQDAISDFDSLEDATSSSSTLESRTRTRTARTTSSSPTRALRTSRPAA